VETSEDRQDRSLIKQLDPFVVMQYISSSIDVIINLKFEDIESKMIEKTKMIKRDKDSDLDNLEVGSLRSGKGLDDSPKIKHKKIKSKDSEVKQSQTEEPGDESESSYGGPSCPKIYEEIIQGLEADVRKHIRMEH
jgi:hypothetical protein